MLKTKEKYLIAILLFLVAFILFNTNTVNATTNSNVIIQTPIENGLLTNIEPNIIEEQNEYSIIIKLDVFKAHDLISNTKKLNSLVKEDGYVYQTIYVGVDDNIDEVVFNGENLPLENISGKNYFKYDVRIFKRKGTNNYEFCCYDIWVDEIIRDAKLEYKNNAEIVKTQSFNLVVMADNFSLGWVELVDEKGDRIDGYEHLTLLQGDGSSWMGDLAETHFDYSNAYYLVLTTIKNTDTIYVDKIGTLTYDGDYGYDDQGRYWYKYKTKVSDPTVFYKPQKITYKIPTVNADGENIYYFNVEGQVFGTERKTFEVNADNNTKISINGVTDVGVSLKADVIDKNDKTYIEMTNSISNIGNYINILAYDLKLVGGDYEGDLLLTFDLGTENNGKELTIWHRLNNGQMEIFHNIVDENGKVTIKVTELSPFLLAYEGQATEQTEQATNNEANTETTKKGEKDETPKTGNENINIILGTIILIIFVKIITKVVKNKRSK